MLRHRPNVAVVSLLRNKNGAAGKHIIIIKTTHIVQQSLISSQREEQIIERLIRQGASVMERGSTVDIPRMETLGKSAR
jgi:hypothetical protein